MGENFKHSSIAKLREAKENYNLWDPYHNYHIGTTPKKGATEMGDIFENHKSNQIYKIFRTDK